MVNSATQASWQDAPCPSWCIREHHDDDHPDDRYHDSHSIHSAAVFAIRDLAAGPGQWALDPDEITVVTSQYDGESTMITFVGREDEIGQAMTMTPDSAARLIEALTQHLEDIGYAG